MHEGSRKGFIGLCSSLLKNVIPLNIFEAFCTCLHPNHILKFVHKDLNRLNSRALHYLFSKIWPIPASFWVYSLLRFLKLRLQQTFDNH